MNIFLYLDKTTWIHRLDPRTKIIGTLIVFTICLCFNDPLYMAGVSVGILVAGISAKALLNFWRLRFILVLLILFSVLMWPFFVKGPTSLWAWGPLHVSRESILYGIAVGLRLASFVGAGLILLSTTRNEELTNGLIRMGLPHPVAFALSTSLRLLPTFAGAGATIIQAQVSRGLDLESGNIFSRIKKFIPQAVPLFFMPYGIPTTLPWRWNQGDSAPDQNALSTMKCAWEGRITPCWPCSWLFLQAVFF